MEAALPERAVDDFFFEREDADGDAADLVVTDGEELFLLRLRFAGVACLDDADEVAFFEVFRWVFDDLVDGSAEDPGMEASETVGLAVFEDDGVHGGGVMVEVSEGSEVTGVGGGRRR